MLSKLACVLFVVPFLADPVDDQQRDLAELQGAWRLVSAVSETGEADVPDPSPAVVIKKDRVRYGDDEIALLLAGSDADRRPIDFHFGNKEKVFEAICTIEDGKLKICLNRRSDSTKERPDAFAIDGHPSWALLTFEKVKDDEEIIPGPAYVGVALRFDQDAKEVLVAEVLDGAPAKKAGLMQDDAVLSVGGAAVTGVRQAVETVRRAKPREELAFRIRRTGKEQDVKVKVGLFPISLLLSLQA